MKKMIVVVLIAVLAVAVVMLSVEQPVAKADYSWETGNYPNSDSFCICIHTSIGTDDDCCVGIGLQAWYDLANSPPPYYYHEGQWSFDANVGSNWQMPNWYFYPNEDWHYCCHDVDQYGYYYGIAFYNPNSGFENEAGEWTLRCWYPGPDINYREVFDPEATSITGQSYMAFYELGNPSNIQYISATPIPYDCLTASGTYDSGWHA